MFENASYGLFRAVKPVAEEEGYMEDMDVWSKTWDLRFKNPEIEEQFRSSIAKEWMSVDCIYCLFCVSVWGISVYRLFKTEAPALPYALLITASFLATAVLGYLAPGFYLKYQRTLYLCLKFLSSYCASAVMTVPTSKETDSLLAFLTYMVVYSKALMMIFSGWIGLPVGFSLHVLEHTVSLAITLYNNGALCHAVRVEQPNFDIRFGNLCRGLTFLLLPFGTWRPTVLQAINPERQCFWAFSWVQITFGYFASCFLVYRGDANARRKFELSRRDRSMVDPPVSMHWVLQWVSIVGLQTWCLLQALDLVLENRAEHSVCALEKVVSG